MQDVRHAHLQYGRCCSHHDGTVVNVPHLTDRKAPRSNFCTLHRARGLRKLLWSVERRSYLQAKSLVAPPLLLVSIVNGYHTTGTRGFEILHTWPDARASCRYCSPFRGSFQTYTFPHFAIGRATSHDASGVKLQDLLIRQNYCSSGGRSIPYPTLR